MVLRDKPASFDPAAATQAWLDTVPPESRAKSDAYFEGGYWLLLWNFLFAAAISIFLLESRLSARLREFAEKITRSRSLQVVLYGIAVTLIMAVIGFPLEWYQGFYREHVYGLSAQTFRSWMGDEVKGLILALIFVPLLLAVLYAVFRHAPRWWWVLGAGVAIFFHVIGTTLAPVFISPVFNRYQPVNQPEIRDAVLAMARANQIPVEQVFQFDASRQTRKISANVSGFLNTTRISLNDNLLKQCSLPEIRYVMGHEMGHYVLNHMTKLVSEFAILAFIAFLLARIVFQATLQKWGDRWRVQDIADPAGYPLLVLIFLASFFFSLRSRTRFRAWLSGRRTRLGSTPRVNRTGWRERR